MLIIGYLLRQYPKIIDKSFLSPLVDQLVSAEIQTKIARKLQLNNYVLSSTIITDVILSDVLEALIAAVYIDSETRSIGVSFYNCAVPVIIDWFKSEIMHSLEKYHLVTSGAVGLDNFPALTTAMTVEKATILQDKQVRSYAAVAATKHITKKPQSLAWSAPKKQEDFPSLTTLTTKTKINKRLPKNNCMAADTQTHISIGTVSTSTDEQMRSYAAAAATKHITKKPQSLVWSAPKKQEDFPPLNASTAKIKPSNDLPKFN